MIKLPFSKENKAPVSRTNFFALPSSKKKQLFVRASKEAAKIQEELVTRYFKLRPR